MKANEAVHFDSVSPWGKYALPITKRVCLRLSHVLPSALAPLTKLLRRPVKYGSTGPIDLVIWGLKLRLMPRGNISEQKLYTAPQFFDRAELGHLKDLLSDGGVFLDIGANAGVYSMWVSCISGFKAKVIAFEPDPEMRRRFTFNCQTNELSGIEILDYALSDKSGVTTFWINESQRGTNSLEVPRENAADRLTKLDVRVRPLLDVVVELGIDSVDAMKIDVEGHEAPILRHFFSNAPRKLWPRMIIAEVIHLDANDAQPLLPQEHYHVVQTTTLNTVWVKRD